MQTDTERPSFGHERASERGASNTASSGSSRNERSNEGAPNRNEPFTGRS